MSSTTAVVVGIPGQRKSCCDRYGSALTGNHVRSAATAVFVFAFVASVIIAIIHAGDQECPSGCVEDSCLSTRGQVFDCTCRSAGLCRDKEFPEGSPGFVALIFVFIAVLYFVVACCAACCCMSSYDNAHAAAGGVMVPSASSQMAMQQQMQPVQQQQYVQQHHHQQQHYVQQQQQQQLQKAAPAGYYAQPQQSNKM